MSESLYYSYFSSIIYMYIWYVTVYDYVVQKVTNMHVFKTEKIKSVALVLMTN